MSKSKKRNRDCFENGDDIIENVHHDETSNDGSHINKRRKIIHGNITSNASNRSNISNNANIDVNSTLNMDDNTLKICNKVNIMDTIKTINCIYCNAEYDFDDIGFTEDNIRYYYRWQCQSFHKCNG